MRDLLRLVGIAILVFAVVGFAMIYSRDSAFRYGVAAFLDGTGGAIRRGFSDLTGLGSSDNGPQLATTTLRIVRPSQTSWIGLTGFPDQTEVHFTVPRVGGYVDGRLDLRFDVQLAEGGDGRLSVAVNGERRSENVLDMGHNIHQISIPLTNADLLASKVVVELAARGTTNNGQLCPTGAVNSGSAINLLPESAMVLTTLQDVNDPQTALIAVPDPLLLYLGRDSNSQAIAMWAAQHLTRAGVATILVDDPLTPGRIIVSDKASAPEAVELDLGGNFVLNGLAGLRRAIEFHRADALVPAQLSDWPVTVTGLTTETMVRNFRGAKQWTIPYKIADLPGGLTPTRFELALRTSMLAEGDEWIVQVSLNGNLLQTVRLPGNVPDIGLAVELPLELQGLTNSLAVGLVDASPNQSVCGTLPDAQAQLLPTSRLTALGVQPTEGWHYLIGQLATAPVVVPGNYGLLNVNQATRIAAMLSQFMPAGVNAAFEAEGPAMMLTALSKNQLAQLLRAKKEADTAPERHDWLVTATGETGTNSLRLIDLQTQDEPTFLNQMESASVAILVQSHSSQ